MLFPPSPILPPIGNGIRNLEIVTINHTTAGADKTVFLTTPVKTENFLVLAVQREHKDKYTLIKPEAIVDGEFTRLRSEQDSADGVHDIQCTVCEFLGAKSINYYSPLIANPASNKTTTITAVDTSKSVIIPLGGFIDGGVSPQNEILTFDNSTTVRHDVSSALDVELGFCVLELH